MRKKEMVDPITYLTSIRQAWVRGVVAGDEDAPMDTPNPVEKPEMPDFDLPDEPRTKSSTDWMIKTAFEIARQRRIQQRIQLRDTGWRPELALASEGRSMAELTDRLYDGGGISLSAERSFR